ncbi:MAG: hypothetical protein HY775_12910 [Acidobacteria bacterium]|nr:hypothetical protein [Acidobacteriota bacterium]
MDGLAEQLERLFALLTRTQPVVEEYDVVWHGPYYIPRRGRWCPSCFTLYRGTLYVGLFVPPARHGLEWKIGSDEVGIERGSSWGTFTGDEGTWADALAQIERRLVSAVRNFEAYNRRVERQLPLACRTGKIPRALTWPRDEEPPLPPREIERFEAAVARGEGLPPLVEMTLFAYLKAAAVAYDAAFPELRPLSALEKYKRKADGRHGGLLDLPPKEAGAFHEWYTGRAWAGTHPWEIVFGHPHGILFSPLWEADIERWRYSLAVASPGWYVTAARMGIALEGNGVPFRFHDWKKVADALRGVDDVPVGSDPYSVSYEELEQARPEALDRIRWDRVPHLGPITPDQAERVSRAESDAAP